MTRLASIVLFVLLVAARLSPALWAQDAHFGPMRSDRGTEHRLCDLVEVRVELTLDERAKTFDGSVANRLIALRDELEEIWFDVAGLEIEGVTLDGADAGFRLEDRRLFVELPRALALGEEGTVGIRYRGASPERGLYFIQPSETEPDLGWEIWSQGQAENNRFWIPTWDYPTDRATYEGSFTVRDGLIVVSNGALLGKELAEPGWVTWRYGLDFPFPTYLISICVGDYEQYVDDFRGIPVEYYVQRGVGEETARRSFGKTPDMIAFFSDMTGIPYPYPKYSQVAVQNFVVGGMENISATTQTDRTLHDAREHLDTSSDSLVAHELAHQWWGDYLTCRTWRHMWLNEGFATYFESLYTEHDQGRDEFLLEMRGTQQSAMGRDRPGRTVPLVESFFSRQPQGGGGNHVYVKGSSVLHMIRTQLGDDLWWRAIHHYGTKHAGQLVDTTDFEIAIEEATGFNLHWLFEEYVYLPGHPEFRIEQSWDAEAKEVVLQVNQVQDTSQMVPVFRYPVPMEVRWKGGTALSTVWIEEAEQEVRLACPSEPLMVRFDKGSAMLKEVEFPKTAEALAYQVRYDDDAVGRMMAVEQIANAGDAELARTTLLAMLGSVDHERIRATAAEELASLVNAEVVAALHRGLGDEAPRIRRSCAVALGRAADALGDARASTVTALAELARRELSYDTQIAALGSLGRLGGDAALAALREACGYESPSDRVAGVALRGRVDLGDETAVYEVLAMAEHADTPEQRASGLDLLGATGDMLEGERRARAVKVLLAAVDTDDYFTRRAAISSLGRLRAVEARDAIAAIVDADPSDRRLRWLRRTAQRALDQIDPPPAVPEAKPVEASAEDRAQVEALEAQMEALEGHIEALRKRLAERDDGEG